MYVCDTHALIYYMAGELPENLDVIFSDAENQKAVIYVPSIVIAEALYLRERGKVDFHVDEMFSRLEKSGGYFVIVPLNSAVLKLLPNMKKVTEIHDKIIAATALLFNSTLITRDPEIIESGYVKTLWD
ncbi:MAG: PIN domain-containing protein [Candidatus Aenigmarchaeota archaeon]|nr:PIN domain-containing protein [Candidatus Aenigmarchaeota archaeon]